MVHKGAFSGSRKEFLLAQKPLYALAYQNGTWADAVAVIQQRYFKCYPVELDHNVEPSPEALAAVDDNAADPEPPVPSLDLLSEEEYMEEMQRWAERQNTINFRKGQIKRWMLYQYMKDNHKGLKSTDSNNPNHSLRQKLTGIPAHRPCRKSPANMWRKENVAVIEAEVKRRVVIEGTKPHMLVALRDRIAREMFTQLDEEAKMEWKKSAESEHQQQLEVWKQENDGLLSTDSVDRQRCIQGLVQFAQPVIDLMCEATGWKVTLLASGPEPAHGGQLNIISVHSGTTSGDVKMNFGRSEQQAYRKYIVPIFGNFLQKCYTPEECKERALPADADWDPLENLDLEEDGATLDSFMPKSFKSILPTAITSQTASVASVESAPNPLSPLLSPMDASADITCLSDIDSPALSLAPTPVITPVLSPTPTPTLSRAPSPEPSPRLSQEPTTPYETSSHGSTAPPKRTSLKHGNPVDGDNEEPIVKRIKMMYNRVSRLSRSPPSDALHTMTAEELPQWLENARNMLNDPSLGESWMEYVKIWFAYEISHIGSEHTGRLGTTKRPAIIGQWIERAHSPIYRPTIKNLDKYENDFIAWWSALLCAVDFDDNESWNRNLNIPGVNGVVSLGAGLYFWGLEVHRRELDGKLWMEMIEDCKNLILSVV